MKWNRTKLEDGEGIVHVSSKGKENYRIIKRRRGLYEVFMECQEGSKGVEGRPFPVHFQWYYLTNFRNPTDAKKFVEGYDVGIIGVTPWEREPYEIKQDK